METLLVVDDEPAVLNLFQHVFQPLGYRVIGAGGFQAALASFAATPPSVAVVDVVLPDGAGLELARKLIELDPQLPVIVITAANTSSTAIAAMKLGVFDYLTKPLNVNEIKQIATHLIMKS